MNLPRTMLSLAALAASSMAHASAYNEDDVTMYVTVEDCQKGYSNWGLTWGPFPTPRSPYTQSVDFTLMSRPATSGFYEPYVRILPPQGNGEHLKPNQCMTVIQNSYYRIQIFARGTNGAQEVSWVTREKRAGINRCTVNQ